MCVKNRGRAGTGGSAKQNGHNFLFCCIHGKGWHQSNMMSGTNNEDRSSATSSLTKTDNATVTTASGEKIEDLSVTAMDQCQRNNKLMTNVARNKVFKCKKFTCPLDFREGSCLWHAVRVALAFDKETDKEKTNHCSNACNKAIADALSWRRTTVTNQMKMNFISEQECVVCNSSAQTQTNSLIVCMFHSAMHQNILSLQRPEHCSKPTQIGKT